MANEKCAVCGAVLALVGLRHNCVARAAPAVAVPEDHPTYRYRNPEKRRAYMRDLMKRKRAKERSHGSCP